MIDFMVTSLGQQMCSVRLGQMQPLNANKRTHIQEQRKSSQRERRKARRVVERRTERVRYQRERPGRPKKAGRVAGEAAA